MKGFGYLDVGSGICGLNESCLSGSSFIKGLDIEVCPYALVIYSIYQGNLTGSLHHEGTMGLDIQGKGFHDMGVNEVNCKIGEIVEMNWSTAKTRFYGT